jgi:hypothetical protein
MEIFFHFSKLTATGGNSDHVQSAYNAMSAGGIQISSEITPGTWTSYRGYLVVGPVRYANLGIKNIGEWNRYAVAEGGGEDVTVNTYADTALLNQTGYYIPRSGGCCFSSGTNIVATDGKQLIAIEKVQPGQTVLSADNT